MKPNKLASATLVALANFAPLAAARLFEIVYLDPGAEAYTFTFG